LAASKADTVGAVTVIIGVAILHGFSFFSAKVILLAIVMMIFNPLVAHVLARSAFLSGHKIKEKDKL
jgi:multicomponent Na+:H+ antiporter subunit G